MDSDEFRHSILEEMGHENFHFELPEHALLWANSFRKELPKPFQYRITKELAEVNPNETRADWDRKSANLVQHMNELAYTGRFCVLHIIRPTVVFAQDWPHLSSAFIGLCLGACRCVFPIQRSPDKCVPADIRCDICIRRDLLL